MLTQLAVGWLLLLAAVLAFVGGFVVRTLIGRHRERSGIRKVVGALRGNVVGRVLFGPVAEDALDDEELDQMILVPAITVSCGLCLTSIFLLGYAVLT
ncbi:hypothetical protein [Mycolicibacterium lacusdiani]|uniref:hypothetical protein n=1 Tax=Mycolicibacterium lacusdiani TaxID=2895283 RepID=UPI0027DFEE6B|nr:hypothetical protein [Mycolicibacterium lacusdiani]